jgi:hypothetical protein
VTAGGAGPEAWQSPSWHALVALAYVLVAAALAARVVIARVRLHRSIAGARPVHSLAGRLPCPVVEHEELGPMVVGLVSPRVVVPSRLLQSGQEAALACVLRHETAHIERGDAWLSAGVQLAAIVAWPVLPVWLAATRMRQLMELACDEAALADADAAERNRYGHTLLDMAEQRAFGVAPAGAGALHFGSTLRARIEALADQRRWPLAAQVATLSVAPLALMVACGGSAAVPAPTGSNKAAVETEGYGYQFDDDSSKAAAGAKPLNLPPGNDGRLPPETIQTAVRASFPTFQACYEAGLAKNPKLAGTVTVKYAFGADGVTTQSADEGSTLPDATVVACVVDAFKKITYPKQSGGEVTVVYPVQFSP